MFIALEGRIYKYEIWLCCFERIWIIKKDKKEMA